MIREILLATVALAPLAHAAAPAVKPPARAATATSAPPPNYAALNNGLLQTILQNTQVIMSALNITPPPPPPPPPASVYISPAAQAEAAAGIVYPAEWTWSSTYAPTPRAATPADNLVPRIEQWRRGGTAAAVVWSTMASDPRTCQQATIPQTSPAGGTYQFNGIAYPYKTIALPNGMQEPVFDDTVLQAMAGLGCGPFGNANHVDVFRMWQPGDTFRVFPAVYHGVIQLQPRPDYYNGLGYGAPGGPGDFDPTDITIQGVTVNGIRPAFLRSTADMPFLVDSESPKDVLEIGPSSGVTIDNLELGVVAPTANDPGATVGFAVVFFTAAGARAHDDNGLALASPTYGGVTTLSGSHVFGGQWTQPISGGANGIASGDTGTGGTLRILNNEIDHNGGSGVGNSSGPGHENYYSNSLDPAFTVDFEGNWVHDTVYGHGFKSRAPVNIVRGNYIQGGVPQGGIFPVSDTYGIDIPNGGVTTIENNIVVKNQSADPLHSEQSNGNMVAFAMEGCKDLHPQSVTERNNTLVALSATWDGSHPIEPLTYGYNSGPGGSQAVPVNGLVPIQGCAAPVPAVVADNVFVGLRQDAYFGTSGAVLAFSEIGQDFVPSNKQVGASAAGQPAYAHQSSTLVRTGATMGAED